MSISYRLNLLTRTEVIVQGSAHFMIGFVFGYLLFRILLLARDDSIKIALYAPLLPFTFGIWFGVPYLTELAGAGKLQDYIGQAVNLFGAYEWLHHQVLVSTYLTGLNKIALVCGFIYLLIIWHYILLIKRLRNQYAG